MMRGAMTEPRRAGADAGVGSLLRRVADGEEEAVARFYDAYADAVFRFVYRRAAASYEDAEEITQDTFLAAIACAATFDGSCAPLTWLCSLAKLRLADFFRRQSRRKRVPPGQLASLDGELGELRGPPGGIPSPEEVPHRIDVARALDRALAALAEDEREVLLLRYVEQFSIHEIGLLMGRGDKAVESLLMRAKKKAARVAARGL
jgi:RNA polymerase sigma-70 factor (ECF subfamily)